MKSVKDRWMQCENERGAAKLYRRRIRTCERMDDVRMNIKKIKIINFRGFSEEKIFEFEGKPFVMLTAPNGKGKTSVIDAIEWCMTGDIKRLHEGYNDRNTNVTERKQNAGAI